MDILKKLFEESLNYPKFNEAHKCRWSHKCDLKNCIKGTYFWQEFLQLKDRKVLSNLES